MYAIFKESDERLMAIKLDNIIIGSRKIHANLPIFNREREYGRGLVKGKEQNEQETKGVAAVNTELPGRNNQRIHCGIMKNYAQVVNNNYSKRSWGVMEQAKKIMFAHLEYNLEDADMERFHNAYIGVVENLGVTYNMQEYFNMEGFFGVKVTPMGEIYVFLRKAMKENWQP
ncbi:unnamed protein product [Vicia faba]|uniref:Uncharacterized protein n=1 Tax=Vicia faba TaxID=3906 RepID=A0AAV0ZEG8_VICFA|nr:unnamed protein product [Vicia faba]